MTIRYFSLIMGLVLTLMGVLGFFSGLMMPPTLDAYSVIGGYGYLFGLFATNSIISVVRLAVGIWGVLAYRNLDYSRTFARSFAIIYGVMAIFGLFPILNTFFGVVPLFGHNIWFHALTAAIGAYYGFTYERTHHIDIHHNGSLQH